MCDVKRLFQEAINNHFAVDADLFVCDVNERTIAQQFANHWKQKFPGWHVDCEYNRDMDAVKRLSYAITPDQEPSIRAVNPDIIIHRRGTNENLAVVEIKKSRNQQDNEKDLAKLRAFVDQLEYQNAVFYRLQTGEAGPAVVEEIWLQRG